MPGLTGVKMSKSDPNSAIFMDDSPEEISRKLKMASPECLESWKTTFECDDLESFLIERLSKISTELPDEEVSDEFIIQDKIESVVISPNASITDIILAKRSGKHIVIMTWSAILLGNDNAVHDAEQLK